VRSDVLRVKDVRHATVVVCCNAQTVFIEDNEEWRLRTLRTCPHCAIEMVHYWTVMSRTKDDLSLFKAESLLLPQVPGIMARHGVSHWDVIIVDGPLGWSDELPGRQQSIATAARYAAATTTVYVHDSHRPLEAR
jgi:hypothetical protein